MFPLHESVQEILWIVGPPSKYSFEIASVPVLPVQQSVRPESGHATVQAQCEELGEGDESGKENLWEREKSGRGS